MARYGVNVARGIKTVRSTVQSGFVQRSTYTFRVENYLYVDLYEVIAAGQTSKSWLRDVTNHLNTHTTLTFDTFVFDSLTSSREGNQI